MSIDSEPFISEAPGGGNVRRHGTLPCHGHDLLAAPGRSRAGAGERVLKYAKAVWKVEQRRSRPQLATMPGHDGAHIARIAYTACKNSGTSAVSLRLLPHAADSGQLALGSRTYHSYRRWWLG